MIRLPDNYLAESPTAWNTPSDPVSIVCDQDFKLLSLSSSLFQTEEALEWENLGFSNSVQLQLRETIKRALDSGYATHTFESTDAPFPGMECLKCYAAQGRGETLVTAVIYACSDTERELIALKESNLELEKYAYNASHDLQEPLNNVTSYLHLMRLQSGESMDERTLEYMNNALNATGNMKTLVRNLLEYSKVGNQKLNWEETSFSDLLAPVILLLDGQIRTKGATIRLDNNENFYCDKFHYGILFQNLISNALKFVAKGVKPKIVLDMVDNGDHFEFSIADNGVGIPDEKHQEIFKTFKRLDYNEAAGYGLGMAIVKRIVEKHGGQIGLESEVGIGTKFLFTIPKRD